jgi:hypothetical protein
MDPDEALREMRKLSETLIRCGDDHIHLEAYAEDVVRLAELVQAIDGWLSKGGFLPRGWESKHREKT